MPEKNAAPDWSDALCAQTDPDAFHPRKGETNAPAKRICGMCDIREQCLQYALENDVDGVYGGLTNWERARIRRDAA